MFANIKDNNVRSLGLHLISDEYWDWMLFKGECYGDGIGLSTECLASHIDMGNSECIGDDGKLYSAVSWQGGVNDGTMLNNIGITGVDNGFISYDKYVIDKKKFLDLFLHSSYEIPSGDTRFFLSPVTGNTQRYSYDYDFVDEGEKSYLALKGGFFQGFYKIEGQNYQTLPNAISNDWHFEFTLRRRSDYETAEDAVNSTHTENAGTFFYMGLRAENKFNEIYNGSVKPEYMETSNGHPIEEQGYHEFETDNKYLFFNHTPTGFTTCNWSGGSVLFTEEKRTYIDNPFLLYNHTKTGHTVCDYYDITVPGSLSSLTATLSMTKSISSNAFSLRVTDDGAVEYKYSVCDPESGELTTLSESTLSGLVPDNQWATINVRFHALSGYVDNCGNQHPASGRKMKMYIYIDGYLVFVSKELPAFNFRALDEVPDKQEGVPYNISIGGGTQGLMDRIWFDYMDYPKNVYTLEREYAGTFIGDIRSFKMYECSLSFGNVKQNNIYEKSFTIK